MQNSSIKESSGLYKILLMIAKSDRNGKTKANWDKAKLEGWSDQSSKASC